MIDDKKFPIRLGVLVVGFVALAAGTLLWGSTRHPARARAAYQRAIQLQRELESKPLRSRTKAEYFKVIHEFHRVYWNDFAYVKAPVAAQAMGDLYAEMGRVFSNPSYFQEAAKSYEYVMDQYPGSSMARESGLSLGKLYFADLHDSRQAKKAYQSLLSIYPTSPEARKAKKRLRGLERLRGKPATETVSRRSPSVPRGDVEITDIHDWVGPNYTRVVIGARAPIKFDATRLTHPDRIVFDLPNTRVSRSLLRKAHTIDGHFLRDIRVGQFQPNVTRVVLDVANVENYSVFPLPNPFRLIIDVHGARSNQAEPVAKRTVIARHRTAPSPRLEASAKPLRHPAPAARPEHSRDTQQAQPHQDQPAKLVASNRSEPVPPHPEKLPISITPPSLTGNGARTLTRALGLKIARIVIDPGHGGHDTGTIGPTGLEEKNVVLDIALRLRKLLRTRTDCQVIMTRTTDKFIPLEERTAIANEKDADLFISIHANASSDHYVRGIETYYLNFTTDPEALKIAARENATSQESVHQLQSLIKKIALSDKVEESRVFARDVQTDLYRDMSRISPGIHNRGVRKAPFVVLIGANMPSILAEVSFLSNRKSERLLRRASYREDIAKALFQGIVKYMDNLGTIRVAQRTR